MIHKPSAHLSSGEDRCKSRVLEKGYASSPQSAVSRNSFCDARAFLGAPRCASGNCRSESVLLADELANRAAVATSVRVFFRLFFVTCRPFASGNLLRTTHAGCESDVPSSSKIHAPQHYHVRLLALWRLLAVCEKKLRVASPPPRYMTQQSPLCIAGPKAFSVGQAADTISRNSLRMMPRRANIEGANSLGYDCDPPMLRATSLTRNTILDGRVFRSSEHVTGSHCASRLGLHLEKRSGISRRIAPVYQLYTSRDASHMLEIWRLSSEEVGLTHNGSRPNFRTALEREFVSHSAYAFPPLRAMHGGGADGDK